MVGQPDVGPPAGDALVLELFRKVIDTPTRGRKELLAKHCKDVEIKRRVGELLDEFEAKDTVALAGLSFIKGASGVTEELLMAKKPLRKGALLGKAYKIERLLDQGGMGRVYLAEQKVPARKVAVKVFGGLTNLDPSAVGRFEVEINAMARLSHPFIAYLISSGTHKGLPFLAMEYIKGVPITQYCADNKLNMDQRLELFLKVCSAIRYAHGQEVIHRDIKPSNILVTQDGYPKIIDFGIAKTVRVDQRTLTRTGMFLGTPDYMSPEQANSEGKKVTRLADVYGLGALLFELLLDRPPLSLPADLYGALKVLVEEKRPRPSQLWHRVLSMEDRGCIAENRGMTVKQVGATLTRDLDKLFAKALDRTCEKRQDSVAQLAAEVTAYRKRLSQPPLVRTSLLTLLMLSVAMLVSFHSYRSEMMILAEHSKLGRVLTGVLADEMMPKPPPGSFEGGEQLPETPDPRSDILLRR